MPFCRRDDAALEILLKRNEPAPEPEWREPPGRLGDYVRRVKRLAQAASERDAS
jgi:hypothetical protein